jgi:hypothetical protein
MSAKKTRKKVSLDELKVESFVTSIDHSFQSKIVGGWPCNSTTCEDYGGSFSTNNTVCLGKPSDPTPLCY